MNNLYYFFLILLCTIVTIIAQFVLKLNNNMNDHDNKNLQLFYKYLKYLHIQENKVIIAVILYGLLGFILSFVIPYKELISHNIIWHIFQFLLLFIIGIYIFNEKINTIKIVAGILGLTAIILFMTQH